MDESHTSVKENWETKLVVLMAVSALGGSEIRLSVLSPAGWCSEGGSREVTFIYSLNFTSVLSSYPPPALPQKGSHPLWQMQKRKGVTEGFSGAGRGKLLNKLETWKGLL